MRIQGQLLVIVISLCAAMMGCERRPVDQVAAISAARQPPLARSEVTETSGNSGTSGMSGSSSGTSDSSKSSASEPCDSKSDSKDQ
jgi:hypothetical protein